MKSYLWLIVILILIDNLYAQDNYKKWLEKERERIQNYLDEQDKKFINFLEQDWEKFNLLQGEKADEKPKPLKIPKYEPERKNIPEDKPKPNEPIEEIDLKEKLLKEELPKIPEIPFVDPPKPVEFKTEIRLNYFGSNPNFYLSFELEKTEETQIDKKMISNFWGKTAKSNYKELLTQILERKEAFRINDWGFITLLYELSKEVYSNKRNLQHLFIWFYLNKAGYKAKVGILNNKIKLFVPTMSKLYDVPYFNSNEDVKLYILDLDNMNQSVSGSLYTYPNDYPDADRIFDMSVPLTPVLNRKLETKELRFSYESKTYKLSAEYPASLIKFYEYYPYTNLDIYFNAAVSEELTGSILPQLREIISDKPKPVAANMLLRFVQTAFDYKTDQPNFGREKPLFPEETIYYEYSDCEDRSVLFAYLVRELLGLEIIGLNYPGHVATAIKFDAVVEGDKIQYDGKEYVICDPTYINAYVGMCMPGYKHIKTEEIIEIN